jgi:hypothetical protein
VSRHVREAACIFRPDEMKSSAPPGRDQASEKAAVPAASAAASSKDQEEEDCRYITCSQCSYRTESRAELLFHVVLHGEPISDPSGTEVAGDLPIALESTTVQSQVKMCLIYV